MPAIGGFRDKGRKAVLTGLNGEANNIGHILFRQEAVQEHAIARRRA